MRPVRALVLAVGLAGCTEALAQDGDPAERAVREAERLRARQLEQVFSAYARAEEPLRVSGPQEEPPARRDGGSGWMWGAGVVTAGIIVLVVARRRAR